MGDYIMDYLNPPLNRANPKVQALHNVLEQAYSEQDAAETIVQRAGLPAQFIPRSTNNMRQFWWEAMDAMADAGTLANLVREASSDVERRAYWPMFRQHLAETAATPALVPPSGQPESTTTAPSSNRDDSTPAEGTAQEPPLSRRVAVAIASAGFLMTILLLLVMIFVAPRLVQQGIVMPYFYVLLVILGAAVAALVFGAMRSSAKLTYNSPFGVVDLAGPMAGIAVVVAGYFLLVPQSDTFDLTVRIRTATGVLNSGSVRLIAGPSTWSAPLNTNGEADFKNLAPSVRTQPLRLEIWDDLNQRVVEKPVTLDATTDIVELMIEPTEASSESVTTTCTSLSILGFSVNDGKEVRQVSDGETYGYPSDLQTDSLVIRPIAAQIPVNCARLTYKWDFLNANGVTSPEQSSDEKLVLTLPIDDKETTIRVSIVDEISKIQASAILSIVSQD
jgi:hypothetical protein